MSCFQCHSSLIPSTLRRTSAKKQQQQKNQLEGSWGRLAKTKKDMKESKSISSPWKTRLLECEFFGVVASLPWPSS